MAMTYDAWRTMEPPIGFYPGELTEDEEHCLIDEDWYDEEKAERLREAMER